MWSLFSMFKYRERKRFFTRGVDREPQGGSSPPPGCPRHREAGPAHEDIAVPSVSSGAGGLPGTGVGPLGTGPASGAATKGGLHASSMRSQGLSREVNLTFLRPPGITPGVGAPSGLGSLCPVPRATAPWPPDLACAVGRALAWRPNATCHPD